MYSLCMIGGSSGQGNVLPQDDRVAYRHSVLEQSTIVTLEGSDRTSESDVTLQHIASTSPPKLQWCSVRVQNAYMRPGMGRPCSAYGCGASYCVFDRNSSCCWHHSAQRTVTNRLLQGQLRARRPVACIPLTPNHCRLRHEWCQARAHWRTGWRSVVFSDENRFCLGASDWRVLVRRSPGHAGPTPEVMVWGEISKTWPALL
ncbi:hypothetical protein AVEN_216714-1 [Araneus ventricosus]|uniref:Transposase Tc1-like domain-containing protein n=1 Tax=Araneus ventricosus TaxID=182803 RepID=A0A4Y2AAT5_ARAVE|nr:hypothetical protein AVEN_216714-1 [Araneus ventricosus]